VSLMVLELGGAPVKGLGDQMGVLELIWGFRSSYGGSGAHVGYRSSVTLPCGCSGSGSSWGLVLVIESS